MAFRDRRLGQEFPVDAVLMWPDLSTSPDKVISKGRYSSLPEVREIDKLRNIKPRGLKNSVFAQILATTLDIDKGLYLFFLFLRGVFRAHMLGNNFPLGPEITWSRLSTYADGTLLSNPVFTSNPSYEKGCGTSIG